MKHNYVKTHLEKLLLNVPVSYYWMGFLTADGTFDHKIGRIRLRLGKKDGSHLDRYKVYINSKSGCDQDKSVFKLIVKKFDIKPSKTYHPPDVNWMNDDLFLAFLIGFIDGDGCINLQHGRKDAVIRIKVHGSWFATLGFMSERVGSILNEITPEPNITADGYAQLVFAKASVVRFLKAKADELPVLERKWSRINENLPNRYEQAKTNKKLVYKLLICSRMVKEIAEETGLSQGGVYRIVKKNNWKSLLKGGSGGLE